MAAQGTFKDKLAWLNWFLAAMLTEWIANLAFEKYAWTIFPYDFVTSIGAILGFTGDVLSYVVGIAVLLGIGFLVTVVSQSKNRGVQYGGSGILIIAAGLLIYWYGWGEGVGAIGNYVEYIVGGIIVIVVIIAIFSSKKEGDKKEGDRASGFKILTEWSKKWGKHGLNFVMRRTGLIKRAAEHASLNQEYVEKGTVPIQFRSHASWIQAHMNFMLRLEVFVSKRGAVEEEHEKVDKLYATPGDVDEGKKLGKDTSFRRFQKQLDIFKNGPKLVIHKNKEDDDIISTNYEEKDIEKRYIDENEGEEKELDYGGEETVKGPMQTWKPVVSFFEVLVKQLNSEGVHKAVSQEITSEESIIKLFKVPVMNIIEDGNFKNMRGSMSEYAEAFKKYSFMKYINAKRAFMLEQYLMAGVNERTYRFARNDAPIYHQKYRIVKRKKGEIREDTYNYGTKRATIYDYYWEPDGDPVLTSEKAGKYSEIDPFDPEKKIRPEVTLVDGYFVADKNLLVTELYHLNTIDDPIKAEIKIKEIENKIPYLRKVKFVYGETVTHEGYFNEVLEKNDEEWLGWLDDFLFGLYHPNSRTVNEYEDSYEDEEKHLFENVEKSYSKEKIKAGEEEDSSSDWKLVSFGQEGKDMYKYTWIMPSKGNPAFDEEAMLDFADIKYWGRKHWTQIRSDINKKPVNPLPGVSAVGLGKFLILYFEKMLGENEDAVKYFDRYPVYVRGQGFIDPSHAKKKEGGTK